MGLDCAPVSPPGKAEPAPLPGEEPAAYALRAAEAKALSVLPDLFRSDPSSVIIAADTIVVLEGRILGKPGNPDRAYAMLGSLAGKTHDVITGCVIRDKACVLRAFTVQSRVSMWDAPSDLLHAYANSGEPLDKAGAYAVQGAGAVLVCRIEGSWSNVVGLPLAELIEALICLNIITPNRADATRGTAAFAVTL
jgi:septum formation protein